MSIDLSGKRAFVTGASRGIGRAIALALRDAGAEVVAGYRETPPDIGQPFACDARAPRLPGPPGPPGPPGSFNWCNRTFSRPRSMPFMFFTLSVTPVCMWVFMTGTEKTTSNARYAAQTFRERTAT